MDEIVLDSRELASRMVVEVRIKNWREFRFRIWLATRFIILAARIGGFGFDFDELEE